MKRIISLLLMFISLATNASVVYNFAGIKAEQINVTGGVVSSFEKAPGDSIPAVDYTSAENTMRVSFVHMENLEFNYQASSEKQSVMRFEEDYTIANGKNIILRFSNLNRGDTISLLVSAKGNTDATFTAFRGANGEDQIAEKKDETTGTYTQKTVSFYATSSEAEIKEITGGFRIYNATITPFVAGADNITTTTADIVWNPDTAVTQYTVSIYTSDTLFAQYIVDGKGNVTDTLKAAHIVAHMPKKRLDSYETFTISIKGLKPGSSYIYTIKGTNIEQQPVFYEEGSFRTKTEPEFTGIDVISSDPDKPRKILYEGKIYILRGDKGYTLTGQKVK